MVLEVERRERGSSGRMKRCGGNSGGGGSGGNSWSGFVFCKCEVGSKDAGMGCSGFGCNDHSGMIHIPCGCDVGEGL